MSVSSGGVSSGRSAPPQMDPNMLLAVALDPKKTSERLAELTKATAQHMAAVVAHGKVAEIEALLADTKAARAEARAKVTKANERAKTIISDAEQKAKDTAAAEMEKVEEERVILRRTRERTTKQKRDIDTREKRFAPLEAELLEKQSKLDKELERTKTVRADFEGRIALMEQTLKQVKI